MTHRDSYCTLLYLVIACSLFARYESAIERVPNSSDPGEAIGSCIGDTGNCNEGNLEIKENGGGWQPFRVSTQGKWISFENLAEKYAAWHERALKNEEIQCSERKILVFTPNAGLGDSIGALTSAYMYAMRTSRLFFINWQPFPWTVTFSELPFFYDYQKALKLKIGSTEDPVLCPDQNDEASFMYGHITHEHPLVKEADKQDYYTDYNAVTEYFMKPSTKVQEVMDTITEGPFKNQDKNQNIHKVAIVMRTGIGEYNQFLSIGDEKNFITCFLNYARKISREAPNDGKEIKFVVFVTSDNTDAKQNAIDALKKEQEKINIEIVTLEDSAIHVMHMTSEESKLKRVRTKLRKTVAEFFIIGMCDAKFLTHGSLFGRTAAERGGGPEQNNFFISDSHCDGKREKHSYLSCHKPKYPSVCELD
uniref:uncharacterized protein LOC120329223 n=1 Tax=Styela clava TaxID=7725 RepID=UPI00193A43B3|nr:uncharacterized protein LOC120329223 [Styela clava]